VQKAGFSGLVARAGSPFYSAASHRVFSGEVGPVRVKKTLYSQNERAFGRKTGVHFC